MKKHLLLGFLALIFIISFSSCSEKNQLKLAAEVANRDCPMRIDEGMLCTRIAFQDNEFQYYVECDEEVLGMQFMDVFEKLKAANEEDIRQSFLTDWDPDIRELVTMLRRNNVNVVYIYTGSITGKQVRCVIDLNQVEEAGVPMGIGMTEEVLESGGSEDDNQSLLELSAELANGMCPETIDEGMVNTAISYDNGAIIYTVECDEDVLGSDFIATINENKAGVKQVLIEGLLSDEGYDNEFLQLIKEENAKVKYHYVGTKTGKVCNITILASEL